MTAGKYVTLLLRIKIAIKISVDCYKYLTQNRYETKFVNNICVMCLLRKEAQTILNKQKTLSIFTMFNELCNNSFDKIIIRYFRLIIVRMR